MASAPDHLAPSFKPWQGPASRASLRGPCPVGPDHDSPPWELFSPIFLPQTNIPCRLHTICLCGDKFANHIFHFIFSILQPGEAVGVWAQNSLSLIPLRACQQTVPCAEHTQSYMNPKQKPQLQKDHFWHPIRKKVWGPWKGHKTQRGVALLGSLIWSSGHKMISEGWLLPLMPPSISAASRQYKPSPQSP